MRIAQILPELNVGGVETGTVDLAKALRKRGDEPYVISNGGRLVDELVKVGIPHLALPVHKKSVLSLRLVRDIASFLERERIDIIHARSRVPAWLAYLAVRRTDCDFGLGKKLQHCVGHNVGRGVTHPVAERFLREHASGFNCAVVKHDSIRCSFGVSVAHRGSL